MLAIDLFAGIGGWSLALRHIGIPSTGIEFNRHAAATRRAAGLDTIEADVRTVKIPPAFDILVGSPPCQAFSQATKGKGLEDPRGQLVFEPDRWVRAGLPTLVCLEQVPGARRHFETMAAEWAELGYSAEVRVLVASDYGVPQRRKRAILVACRGGEPRWPAARPEVSMACALPDRTDLPAWAHERPATTIVGTFRPEIVSSPGYRKAGGPSRQHAEGGVSTSIQERLILQGFPADWPLQGPKTAQSLQVGNAIPPPLAGAVLRANLPNLGA